MVKPEEDYGNPVLWLISIVALVVGVVSGIILRGVVDLGPFVGAIFSMTVGSIVWIILWVVYKRTDGFKKKYGKK
jgi:hypothetical protein